MDRVEACAGQAIFFGLGVYFHRIGTEREFFLLELKGQCIMIVRGDFRAD